MHKNFNLSKMTEEELIKLNREVVARIRAIEQKKRFKVMMKFNIGEGVSFNSGNGKKINGTIIKINKKTISLVTQDQVQWNVHPSLFKKVGLAKQPSIRRGENVIPLKIS